MRLASIIHACSERRLASLSHFYTNAPNHCTHSCIISLHSHHSTHQRALHHIVARTSLHARPAHIHIHIHIHTHICVYIYIYICIHTSIHIYIPIHPSTSIHTSPSIHPYIYTYTHIHIHPHIHIYTSIHTSPYNYRCSMS